MAKKTAGSSKSKTNRASSQKSASTKPTGFSPAGLIQTISGREGGLLLMFLIIALIICVRLVILTIVDAEALSNEGQQRRTTEYKLTASRGQILDRNGKVLAQNVEATTIYADPTEIIDARETASILHEVLGGSVQEYMEALTSPKDPTFSYISKKTDNSIAQRLQAVNQQYIDQEIEAFRAQGNDIPIEIPTPLTGIHYLQDTKRFYPCGNVGAQIIGSVDDENLGISGLELTYDSILRGIDGKLVLEKGKPLEQGQLALPIIGGVEEQVLAVDGQDIIISLDIELQQFVENNLKAIADQRTCANANSLVLDGGTGEIYAAASIPLFDRENLKEEDAKAGATTVKAITEPYEPGSTFKAFIAGLALENGTMRPDDSFYCPPWLDIYDYTIKDATPRGGQEMSLRQIISQSSNIGVSLIEQKIGDYAFADFLVGAGIGMPTHVDYPGETNGMLDAVEDWNPVQAANIAFGQGVQVSSLHIASYYGAIANDGVLIQPHFVIARPQFNDAPSYPSKRIMKTSAARDLEDLLRGVVTEGTGTPAAVDGFDAVGKTGTAEKASEYGGYLSSEYIQSFVGYLNNSTSKLVCISAFDNAMGAIAPSSEFFPIVMSFAVNRYMIAPQVDSVPIYEQGLPSEPEANQEPIPKALDPDPAATKPKDSSSTSLAKQEYQSWSIDTSG